MRVGITCDLKSGQPPAPGQPADYEAEFDSETTISAIESAIRQSGDEPIRIGDVRGLIQFLAAGCTADIVFNMAEGRYGRSREAQVPALLEAYNIPHTMSDPLGVALSLDKYTTKRLWREAGLPTAPFALIGQLTLDSAAHEQSASALPGDFPLFIKPVHEGSSKGIDQHSVVYSYEQLWARAAWLLETYHEPALVETFLPGREFTVGILGNGPQAEVLGIVEITSVHSFPVNGFEQKEHMKNRPDVFIPLAESDALHRPIGQLALQAFQVTGCWDVARVDVRLDRDGNPHLLEINPIAGLHPTHSALPAIAHFAGMEYAELIQAILAQALQRYGMI